MLEWQKKDAVIWIYITVNCPIQSPDGKRLKKNDQNLRDLWSYMKQSNIHVIEILGGEKQEKMTEKLFEKNVESLSNLLENINLKIQILTEP